MTQQQFNKQFKKTHGDLLSIPLADRLHAYNDYICSCYMAGLITEKQQNKWTPPSFLKTSGTRYSSNPTSFHNL